MTQIDVVQWHEPENDEVFDYLLENVNTKIVDGSVEWQSQQH